ncbi:TetR/AcrR family transcriptional regulator [Antrihabitans sp. YC2-6]|uniref:TetR/AcrR family transcriptional regulator n=1 Tax=Antrihabitans sp. YC2-6 TaxID=2799498 RepID=UPI0018F565AB|nr:TetR/AcrR family transcriptional regulator [Antrihabitans sp. YC2-6]MBJ8348245.1 TetR family transcriptional regulator [Antrihabitans sp. YC2-6]
MIAAETLFARQGVAGTSLQELADAVGLTRTGIYHYVSGKDELLGHLVRGFTLESASELQKLAEDVTRDPTTRLKEGVAAMAARVAEHPQRFRLLLTSEDSFPDALAKQHRRARRATLAALMSLVSQGINDGSFNPVDPELTAFALAGVANWVAFWFPRQTSGPQKSPREIGDALAAIALGGVISARASTDDPDHGVPHALALLRTDVQRLEHLWASANPVIAQAD